jgi:hypothetical protein
LQDCVEESTPATSVTAAPQQVLDGELVQAAVVHAAGGGRADVEGLERVRVGQQLVVGLAVAERRRGKLVVPGRP